MEFSISHIDPDCFLQQNLTILYILSDSKHVFSCGHKSWSHYVLFSLGEEVVVAHMVGMAVGADKVGDVLRGQAVLL